MGKKKQKMGDRDFVGTDQYFQFVDVDGVAYRIRKGTRREVERQIAERK